MKRWIALGAVLVALASTDTYATDGAPIGVPGDPAKADRKVEIDMSDFMLFTPSKVEVREGETVNFVVSNRGQIAHEFVLGTAADLQAHATMMKDHPEMVHTGPGHFTVDPGKKVEFAWQFTSAGTVEYGCLIPGHFDAGMRGRIIVKQ